MQIPLDVGKNLRVILFKSLLVPLLVLVFFIVAPHWLNSRIRTAATDAVSANANLSPLEKEERLARIARVNFQQVCLDCPPGMEKLHDNLEQTGIVGNFQRLQWGLYLSITLVAGLGIAIGAIFSLNQKAGQSPAELIRCYRLSWKIGITAALVKVFLLIPLLAYGTFEFSVLLSDHYFPKLLLVIVLGGLFALWRSAAVLLKKVPLEFKEPMAREVTPEEAPELWQKVREVAARLQTAPPDRIIIGLQLNFYVTELAVLHDSGKTEGRTLYLSYPLLRQLPEDEVLAIIGHELGHFMGADTQMTREFYPMRLKVRGTMIALAQSGWVGWPSFQFLNFFTWCFGETEQKASRARELLADQKAALVTSARTAAQALVRFQVLAEAFQRGLKEAIRNRAQNPLSLSLQPIVRDKLAPEAEFWTQLFEKKLPHPLDSHPSLQVRLDALGQSLSASEAQSLALAETRSAYDQWLSSHEALFAGLASQAEAAVSKLQTRAQIAEADYQTASGKELLDRLFPEKKWRSKPSGFWAAIGFMGLLFGLCLTAVIFINDLGARVIIGLIGILFGLFLAGIWIRYRRSELTLNAEGVFHSGWKRPVRFKEVEKLLARRSYSNITLTFRLKAKQPPIWKFSGLPLARKTVAFSLSGFDEKPLPMAQTIFRYFTRQMEPAGTKT